MFPYMFPQNELLMEESARERRQKLMREARSERLFRYGCPRRASWIAAALVGLGRWMVQYGQQLERRGSAQVDSI
ncbi:MULTISPECIES: hypothetical protein [Caldilinea]|jgi:hypothetical protein|uniref:Uncharacterized protein n=1 Tax=Caldilinea aerophila (strain DSM 14535 / JCM 11387 / NBRC 104270 / STL-6-O1) TaxID=926550 RepID=I0I178_CALAS|nr:MULTISPECIES: hypothetical protein [Caldilinea]MBO9394981.1 hypothetical protein [Caldilinea sp.]BAL99015.1 hypothetical protein CLDAP_09760 [Caldilinea aerophila DSM 14535 = NBRC 104270]GIV74396.1 MAG: hypothetical protein KatS3mg049_2952 [Caldilinea sp.]